MESEFEEGKIFRETFRIDSSVIEEFAGMSGDTNPLHMVEAEAQSYGYVRQVAHGAILVAFVSRMIGMKVPGPGAVWLGHSVDWLHPVYVNDEVTLEIEIVSFSRAARILGLRITALNQTEDEVMKGTAKVKIAERLSMTSDNSTGIQEHVALVTGGSRGLGAEIARELASRGLRVAVGYHSSKSEAEGVVQSINESEPAAIAVQADLSDPGSAKGLVQETIEAFGRVDVIVHSASPPIEPTPFPEQGYEGIQNLLNFYLGRAHELTQASLPGMRERGYGRMIFLGTSYLLSSPPQGLSAYITAKEALWGYVKSMAVELGAFGITSNMVSPGMTITDLTSHVPVRLKEVEARKNPMRRLATKSDTAQLVAFLAGEGGGYINGANLPVCGGPL